MKIAIATEGGQVAQHFGRCSAYTIVEAENNTVNSRNMISNPGHEPGFLPGYLAQMGVTCIIAGAWAGAPKISSRQKTFKLCWEPPVR